MRWYATEGSYSLALVMKCFNGAKRRERERCDVAI